VGKIRRKFDIEFKRQVAAAVDAGMPINEVARQHKVSPSVVSGWYDRFRSGTLIDRPTVKEKALEKENQKLKAKIGELVVQIDVLKKQDEWIRQRRKLNSSIITEKNLAEFRKGAES
jgi:transposase-like protein